MRRSILSRVFAPEYEHDPHRGRRRFLVLAIFSVLTMSNNMQWLTWSQIFTETKQYYGVNTEEFNWLASIYPIGYACLCFLSCASLQHLGLRGALIVGTTLNWAGSAVKLMAGFPARTYAAAIIAQCFSSLGQVFLLAVPPSLSAVWFPLEQRTTATAFSSGFNTLGGGLGMLIPPLIMHSQKNNKRGFLFLYAFQFALCTIPLLGLLLIPTPTNFADVDQPDMNGSPATVVEENCVAGWPEGDVEEVESQPTGRGDDFGELLRGLQQLGRDKNVVSLVLSVSLSIGAFWAVSTFMAQILSSVNVGETDAGIIGFWNIATGAVLAVCLGAFLDHFRHYHLALVFAEAITTVLMACIIAVLHYDKTTEGEQPSSRTRALLYVLFIVGGIPQNLLIPVGFEFAMEICYGYPDSITGGAIMGLSNAFCLILTALGARILGNDATPPRANCIRCFALIVGTMLLGIVLSLIPRNTYSRRDGELAAAAARKNTPNTAKRHTTADA